MTNESTSDELSLYKAYAICRGIARREAKNFYYAFIALPTTRRNAISAIYAFMRRADDLADDENFSIADRRKHLDAWLAATGVAAQAQAVRLEKTLFFLAVRDATTRFAIPLSLLDELVAGVTMDLDSADTGAPDTYATFADLYRYCYLVASVVGLVCIRIFTATRTRAPKNSLRKPVLPFSFTNILRDVAEDASLNRVYLPLEDLAAHNVSLDSLLHREAGAPPTANELRAAPGHRTARRILLPIGRGIAAFH